MKLAKGQPALTKSLGMVLVENISVCYHQTGKINPVSLNLSGICNELAKVRLIKITDQLLKTYADLQDATENAAVGLALATIIDKTNYKIIERSMKSTGIDYWLGEKDDPGPLFQRKARLEVSGILKGSDSDITKRVNSKIKQAERSANSGLSVFISVSEFTQSKTVVNLYAAN